MPWRKVNPMEERVRFVLEHETDLFSMTELCERFGVSRKTGYQLVAAYAAGGVEGLAAWSRRLLHSLDQIDSTVVKAVLTWRRRHPGWGPKKLLWCLDQHEAQLWTRVRRPRVSTVARLLTQHGLTTTAPPPRRVWRQPALALAPSTAPNLIWTVDYKGEFRTGDARWCYPLTIMDSFSRYLLCCDGFLGPTTAVTRRAFERVFAVYGLPDRIRSDNGTPFAGPGVGGLSPLSVWWMRLGIGLERIARGHPEQNGAHERMHRTLKAATARPPAAHRRAQQRRFARFLREYNDDRPHEALGQQLPTAWYTPSARAYPRRLPPLEYPGHLDVCRVAGHGDIYWRQRRLFVSESLAGEHLGLEEVDDGLWEVWFGSTVLARLDLRTWTLHPRPD